MGEETGSDEIAAESIASATVPSEPPETQDASAPSEGLDHSWNALEAKPSEPSAPSSPTDLSQDEDWIIEGFEHGDQDKIAGEISIRKGALRVHLRHMFSLNEGGNWFWTRRGVAFPPAELPAIMESLERAIGASKDGVEAGFPAGKDELRVGSNTFRGVRYVYVRRFYQKGETWHATQKGVSVRQDEGELLLELVTRLQAKCVELGLAQEL